MRRRQRALADEWLLWGATPRDASNLLAARARELTAAKRRESLARLCRRFLTELANPRCRAYAVNRPAMREHRELLVQLADRLEDDEGVSPRGIILVARVLEDGGGPLFDHARANELGPALVEALRALDDHRAQ